MDTTKLANAVFTHRGTVHELEGLYRMPRENGATGRPLELARLACIPTTAGTGSEVSMGP